MSTCRMPPSGGHGSRGKSARQVFLCELDKLPAAPIQHGAQHEEAELMCLVEGGHRRHHQFLAGADDTKKCRAVMGQHFGQSSSQILWLLDPDCRRARSGEGARTYECMTLSPALIVRCDSAINALKRPHPVLNCDAR